MSDRGGQAEVGAFTAGRVDVRLVPAALTCWVVTAAAIRWPVGRTLAGCCVVLAAVAGALAWRAAARPGPVGRLPALYAGLVAIGVVGAGFGMAVALRAEAVSRHPIAADFGAAAPVTLTPTDAAVSVGRGRLMFRANLQRLRDDPTSGRVVVFARAADFGGGEVAVGRPLRFTARIGRPRRHDLTVAELNASGRPTGGTAAPLHRAAQAVRDRFGAAARAALPAEQAALLPALVLGDTSAIDAPTGRDFRSAGMTHLMAVSGANVTIVCGAVLFCARLLGPRPAVLLAALVLVAFVIVVQPSASVLRAAVMGAVGLAGVLTSRRRQAVPALCATVLVLLAVAPQLAVDVGFALSVVATAALIVIAPPWSRRLLSRGCPKPLADALAVACAAQVVTAPLIAGISGRFSVVAAVANLAAAPVIAPITVLGTAAAAMCSFWPGGAEALVRFTGPELWWVGQVARSASGFPAATLPVPSGAAGVLLVSALTVLLATTTRLWWRRRWYRRGVALAAVLAALFPLAWSLAGLTDPSRVWGASDPAGSVRRWVVTPSWGERACALAPGPRGRGIARRTGRVGGPAGRGRPR